MIFNIQRFSLHDGEGLRTTVFFKGCSLSCSWCSNPESQSFHRELLFDSSRCIGCGDCLAVDSRGAMFRKDGTICFDPEKQHNPERYDSICPARALQLVGEEKTADEIVREVLKDKAFYGKNGGVTLSGGEPLMQPELCRDVAEMLRTEGVHVAIETCLHVPWKNIELLIPHTDEFLCDAKHINPEIFREQTGGDLNLIWDNLEKLASRKALIRARIPVIDGFNHDPQTMNTMLERLAALGISRVDFMPYHPLGSGKYRNLGRPYGHPDAAMPDSEIDLYIKQAGRMKLTVRTGG